MGSIEENLHIVHLPATPAVSEKSIDAEAIAKQWIENLEQILATKDFSRLSECFHDDSWWRDMLAVDWEFHTIKGIEGIRSFLGNRQPLSQLSNLRIVEKDEVKAKLESPADGLTWVTAMFSFDTQVGRGRGVLYLTLDPVNPEQWKAYSVYTSLQELKKHEERLGLRRDVGTIETMPGGVEVGTWLERRQKASKLEDGDPTVLIIGAGQAGLNLGARLQSVGVSCLLIDKNERVGDNWRKRYRTLTTHDHAETAHMAYLPFPKTWPMYTSKDKLGDWFESYASIMELDVWLRTEAKAAEYDDESKEWTVTLSRDGFERSLHVKHVAWCAGHIALPSIPNFPGMKQFKGDIYHSSQHQDARALNPQGKKVVVVGTGNSGHDIAQDFYEQGADVTLLQRGPTYVITEAKGLPLLPENLSIDKENQPSLEDADVMSESLPWPVMLAMGIGLTEQITAADKETLDGLEKAGFKLEFGPDGAGFLRLLVTRGGGYYIDFGCSQLIIDGKIGVKSAPGGIAGFEENALLLSDGSRLDADVVVLATGYDNMRESVRKVLGDKVANRLKDVWNLDDEGELKTIWRPSGHPGFWFMGGSLSLCRIYSKFVALQIQATEEGLIN